MGVAFADSLAFMLPAFTRFAWTSESARSVWDTRLKRIGAVQEKLDLRSLAAGMRRCALFHTANNDMALQYGKQLICSVIGHQEAYSHWVPGRREDGNAGALVMGRAEAVEEFREAWIAGEEEKVASMLGYPECCRRILRHHLMDPTWVMATSDAKDKRLRMVEIQGRASSNIFWRYVDIRAVPHWPCSFRCKATADIAARLRELASGEHEMQAIGWRDEILSWPVEWSALHGIAEIRTPVLKIVTRTESTAGKYVVRWQGSTYPAEGARGLRFPYDWRDSRLVQIQAKRACC